MTEFIQHTAGEMDEDLVQRCVICGAILSDYRNMMSPAGSPDPKGYASGPIQVSTGNPRITTIADMSDKYKVTACQGRTFITSDITMLGSVKDTRNNEGEIWDMLYP